MEVINTFLLTTMHNSLLLKKKDSPNYKGKDLHGSYFHRERKNTLNALLKKPMVAYNQIKYAFICHLQSFCHSWGAWSICELCQFLQLIKSKSLLGSSEFSSFYHCLYHFSVYCKEVFGLLDFICLKEI